MTSIYYQLGRRAALEKVGADSPDLLTQALRARNIENQEQLQAALQELAQEEPMDPKEFQRRAAIGGGAAGTALGGITGAGAGGAAGALSGAGFGRGALRGGLAGGLGGGALGAGLGYLQGGKYEDKYLPQIQDAQQQAQQLLQSPEEQQELLGKIGAAPRALLAEGIREFGPKGLDPKSGLTPDERDQVLQRLLKEDAEGELPSSDQFRKDLTLLGGATGATMGGMQGPIIGALTAKPGRVGRGALKGLGIGALGGGALGAGAGYYEGGKYNEKYRPEMEMAQQEAQMLMNDPAARQRFLEELYDKR